MSLPGFSPFAAHISVITAAAIRPPSPGDVTPPMVLKTC
jgi:hypothetical protein